MGVNTNYKWCSHPVKSPDHIFRHCWISRHVWAAGNSGIKSEGLASISLSEWINNWLRMLDSDQDTVMNKKVYFVATLWTLWKERHETLFKNKQCSPRNIMEAIKGTYEMEIKSLEANKATEDKGRYKLEEPPGFEKDREICEPPGFDRSIRGDVDKTIEVLGDGKNYNKTILKIFWR